MINQTIEKCYIARIPIQSFDDDDKLTLNIPLIAIMPFDRVSSKRATEYGYQLLWQAWRAGSGHLLKLWDDLPGMVATVSDEQARSFFERYSFLYHGVTVNQSADYGGNVTVTHDHGSFGVDAIHGGIIGFLDIDTPRGFSEFSTINY